MDSDEPKPFLQSREVALEFIGVTRRPRRTTRTAAERAAYFKSPARKESDRLRWEAFHERRRLGQPALTRDDDHPRRCTAMNRHTGQRCRRWAVWGKRVCGCHGGNNPGTAVSYGSGNLGNMPGIYSKYLGPTLQEKLDEFIGKKTHAEQLQLYEEIGLARSMLAEQLRLASLAFESKNDGPDAARARQLASDLVLSGVDRVADLCAKMAVIEERLDDKVSVRQISMFVEQITRLIYARLGEEGESVAAALANDLKTKIRMPTSDIKAVRIRVPGTPVPPVADPAAQAAERKE